MRLTGALLLLAAGWEAGTALTGALRRKCAVLRELAALLSRMAEEIGQRETPLPQVFAREAERTPLLAAPLRVAAKKTAAGLPAGQALQTLCETLSLREGLPQAARAVAELSALLGAYDAETQARACRSAEGVLRTLEQEQERLLAEKGRLYRALAFSAGAILALLAL